MVGGHVVPHQLLDVSATTQWLEINICQFPCFFNDVSFSVQKLVLLLVGLVK